MVAKSRVRIPAPCKYCTAASAAATAAIAASASPATEAAAADAAATEAEAARRRKGRRPPKKEKRKKSTLKLYTQRKEIKLFAQFVRTVRQDSLFSIVKHYKYIKH